MNQTSVVVEQVSPAELTAHATVFAALLKGVVNTLGCGLGFVAPLTLDRARDYWLSLRPELEDGRRVLVIARDDGQIVGSGQLALSSWPNALHRAELQKLFVSEDARGRGVGRQIILALHDEARARGRSLILLGTHRDGGAERLYKSVGYQEIGVIPRYARGPGGVELDQISMYIELD